ncbi:MAG: hypothetical protein ABIU54_14720 [Candidatus Eisenbacteria bacterium]
MERSFRGTILAVLLLAVSLTGCSSERITPTAPAASAAPARSEQIGLVRAVHNRMADYFDQLEGVEGHAVEIATDGSALIRLYTSRAQVEVPAQLAGVRIVTQQTGVFRPFALTDKLRPVPIGASIGNDAECLPGTVGAFVVKPDGRRYILCANHVFARLNTAALGEPIVQPSRVDGSAACTPLGPDFRVASLSDFEPLVFGNQGANVMDAAIAQLDPRIAIETATLADGYGAPGSDPIAAQLDMDVQKYGRTTGLTQARVKAVDVSVKLTFPSGTVRYVGQIMTTRDFAGFGDSGSLVVTRDQDKRPVGIVIGGSNTGAAIVTPIQPILQRFGVRIMLR